jgi:hypothetical protein
MELLSVLSGNFDTIKVNCVVIIAAEAGTSYRKE